MIKVNVFENIEAAIGIFDPILSTKKAVLNVDKENGMGTIYPSVWTNLIKA